MREILFRGKRIDNGKWVNGYYRHHKSKVTSEEISQILVDDGFGFHWMQIIPATVGQYTGLKDKKGKKIFEGDIVEGRCHSAWRHDLQRCEVAYGRDGFEARHYVNCGDEWRYFTYRVLFSKDVVVIGNIHDNPELLEGGEQNER